MMRLRATWLIALLAVLACGAPAPAASPAAPPSDALSPPALGGAARRELGGGGAVPALQAIVDGARQEGALSLTWGEGTMAGSEGARRIADGLNRRYGLNLTVQFTPVPPISNMGAKIKEETQAGRRTSTDVMVAYGNVMAELIQAGTLTPVDWLSWAPNVRNPELLAPDGLAVTFQTSYTGITYNTEHLTGDAIPRTMQDLLKPEYRGRVASTPYGAIFDYLATDELWGEERTIDYLTRFADQLAGLIRCNETSRVASGEFDLFALTCSQSNALEPRAHGAPVDVAIPSDAAFLQPLYMAVPRNAAHPNAARLWVDYVLSREVQEVLADLDQQDSHLLEGSKTAQELAQRRGVGVQFAVASVEFVLRQDETEFGRRRARIQQVLAQH